MSERIRKAAEDLLAQIELQTDCMDGHIERESLDDYMDALEAALDDAVGKMSFHVQELRPEVLAFALLMEQRLREKDADKGQRWKQKSIAELGVDVCMMNRRLEIASYQDDSSLTVRVAVDHANICMFIADVAGALEAPELERKADGGGPGWAGVDQANTEPLEIPAFLRRVEG